MLAVELEGTIYGGGRHQRREGFNKDAEKYREAVKLGWRVMRYTSDDLKQRPVQCVDEVAELLKPT
jgi:very-short-patch-repair endonuclease